MVVKVAVMIGWRMWRHCRSLPRTAFLLAGIAIMPTQSGGIPTQSEGHFLVVARAGGACDRRVGWWIASACDRPDELWQFRLAHRIGRPRLVGCLRLERGRVAGEGRRRPGGNRTAQRDRRGRP